MLSRMGSGRGCWWLGFGVALFVWGLSPSAMAYCRTTTEAPPASSCPEPCDEEGVPLFWPTSKLTYTFHERMFPDLSERQVREIFATSFGAWEAVSCAGEPIGFEISADVATTSEGVGHVSSWDPDANRNVILYLSAEEWDADPDLPTRAFAITSVWFNEKTAEILGADMQFNGNLDPFGICPPGGCDDADGTVDLQNVVTHEAGHFLGLAHSADRSATMSCDASPGDVDKRTLGQDDIDGLCDAYPSGDRFRGSSSSLSSRRASAPGCALAEPGLAWRGGAWAFGAAAALIWARRRRRA